MCNHLANQSQSSFSLVTFLIWARWSTCWFHFAAGVLSHTWPFTHPTFEGQDLPIARRCCQSSVLHTFVWPTSHLLDSHWHIHSIAPLKGGRSRYKWWQHHSLRPVEEPVTLLLVCYLHPLLWPVPISNATALYCHLDPTQQANALVNHNPCIPEPATNSGTSSIGEGL